MQVWYRTVSLVTSSEFKQKFVGKSVTLRLVKNFRGWRLTTKIMKLNQPRNFLRIRYKSGQNHRKAEKATAHSRNYLKTIRIRY